ncbi:hypothetical protein CEXT_687881 [Caerostris extrusa]|uniref:Uncharacterized protein n=1 Tax=Caerostris extrusa TaxID=172846 RepID=A0AAV4QTL0_CAEEX|nr:hypothetical protein CEXT_687881 [Caerostris extrusa]
MQLSTGIKTHIGDVEEGGHEVALPKSSMSKRFEKNARPSEKAAGTVILFKCIKYLHFGAGLKIIASDAVSCPLDVHNKLDP